MMDVIHEARMFEQFGARPDLEDYVLAKSMADRLTADWKRLGMEGVYAFPEFFLRDSQARMARHRLLGFNAIRSNPKICGFNLTGLLDHVMAGKAFGDSGAIGNRELWTLCATDGLPSVGAFL